MLDRYKLRIWSAILDPTAFVFKTVLKRSEMVVGFGKIFYHSTPLERSHDYSLSIKATITEVHGKQMEELRIKHLDGQEHVCKSKQSKYPISYFKGVDIS
jgi:hypothetical protein